MSALVRAVECCGGQSELARLLGGRVRQGHVWHWLHKSALGVPAEYCLAIEEATAGRVTRYELRPDVFGPPPPQVQEAA